MDHGLVDVALTVDFHTGFGYHACNTHTRDAAHLVCTTFKALVM